MRIKTHQETTVESKHAGLRLHVAPQQPVQEPPDVRTCRGVAKTSKSSGRVLDPSAAFLQICVTAGHASLLSKLQVCPSVAKVPLVIQLNGSKSWNQQYR